MNLPIKCDLMLLEAFEFLAKEIIADKAIERVASQAERFKPGLGKVAYRIAGGAQAGIIVGSYAGRSSAENFRRGIPSAILERTPEIARYEESAIGTSRRI